MKISNYNIFINVDENKLIYLGYVIIKLQITEETNIININAINFTIKNIFINKKKCNFYEYDNKNITFMQNFLPNN
jgi:hypothetical protein